MLPDPAALIRTLAVSAIPLLFAITLHEAAHGWMARRFGDRTAEMLGRLSLNPVRHIDPVGTVVVPLVMLMLGGFIFGWAKPVPINPRALRDPRRDMILIAAAGPLANIAMAITWVLLFRLLEPFVTAWGGAGVFLGSICAKGLFFNVLLAVFNLLPIPPLDGARMLRGLLPPALGQRLDSLEPYGLIIVVALLAIGVLDDILGPLFIAVQQFVLWASGIKGGTG
jgi:Zn-dependent protease